MVHYHFTWLFKTCTVGARDVLPINCFSSFWMTYLRRKCQVVFKGPWHGHPTISSFQWKLDVEGLLYLERYERLAVKEYFSAKQTLEVSGWKSHPLAVTAILPWLQWHHVQQGVVLSSSTTVSASSNCSVSLPNQRKFEYLDFMHCWPQNNIFSWNADTLTASCLLRHSSKMRQYCLTLRQLACL